jgi:NAD(P)-dependent dehydrogenase (short-subunit alcohol dehydrogenase family)
VFEEIQRHSGRLDILVNNATMIHPELISPKPFWEKGLDAAGILEVGLRSAYVASWHAAHIMVPQGSGPDCLWFFLWCELLHAWTWLWGTKGRYR